MKRIVSKALHALNQAIANGAEYPDAECAVASRLMLTDIEVQQLRDVYDTQDMGTFAEKVTAGLPL